MAQPAVSVGVDRAGFVGVPAFWPKPTTEPLFPWESWIEQFLSAFNLREHCNANIILSDPVEVFDDPRHDQKEKVRQKAQEKKLIVLKEDQTEI